MERSRILEEIAGYCRAAGMAETTFGRLAVNDGKLVGRIRNGGRISARTLERIDAFIAAHPSTDPAARSVLLGTRAAAAPVAGAGEAADLDTNFRFFDNRQKYLLFVNTCGEKQVAADRVALELANIHPRPPAVRLFDAGVGDGTLLSRVMRAMHHRFATMPFYIVGKEISLEDVRLTLDKMPDRFFEHPATVLVLTNLYYSEAPWLTTRSARAAGSFVWKECVLRGDSSHDFQRQIADLEPFLADNWQARISRSGNPIYDRPVVLVLYREDHRFLLDPVIPKLGAARADYDLVVASQPYRARASAGFKAAKVVAPLARALGPGGRLIGIHSYGHDPGMEIVRRVWPEDDPFRTDRHDILRAVKADLGPDARHFNFNAYSDKRSIFRYDMHTLPSEVGSSIGTSTLFAAWNAAVYVAQVEDERLEEATRDGRYLDATRAVLRDHGGLWFFDESYAISRRRD
ncbi:hypothetical protein [Polymorphum gilvum]|uniref:Uncharacterized protein n=1 Tax=Polymorphum gilvum (strain LMG 25793 / CGMCC 1.9160 / SL003B-26A1) TaxID=991905 RepID=F2J4F3_POLGS|nr:hypothetical protein [Polymorphum gilvum]ADZ71095.1 hypothetical protein SL003B_2672 [Polymorphum gilvum SL003B-26A1]